MIALIDYGAGNLGSVLKAIQYLGYTAEVASQPEQIASAAKLILPGQGHFGAMMKALDGRGLLEPLREALTGGKPYLGICLGLQALYEDSDEAPGVKGLGLLPGRVKRFQGVFKVPHLGWNQLRIDHEASLLRGVANGSFAYYCHSFYGPVTDATVAVTDYGQAFAAVLEAENLAAVQFHPEKSAGVGLQVLRNFLGNSSH
jgi:imidazole glycerol phosphate synthase glutamine amidotransferase subunit